MPRPENRPPGSARSGGCLQKSLAIIGGLILLGMCSRLLDRNGDNATPRPTAVVRAVDTATLEPTATRVPTETPQPTVAPRQTPIPGLTAADLKLNLRDRQFECTDAHVGELLLDWSCELEARDLRVTVLYYGESPMSICLVEGTVLQFGDPDDDLAASVLGFLATLPYDGAEPDRARAWVEETLPTIKAGGDVRTATFGGVPFQLYGPPTARILEIGTLR